MNRRSIVPAICGLLLVVATACGDAASGAVGGGADPGDGGVVDVPDTRDPGTGDPPEPGDEFPTDRARDDARAVLGMNEADLPDDVRIGRRGDERLALTEDYMLGRLTVELDDTDDSGFRVVSVTVELPAGPETFELEPG